MVWSVHSYIEYSTTYVGISSLRRKSAFLRRIKISSEPDVLKLPHTAQRRYLYEDKTIFLIFSDYLKLCNFP